MESPGKMRRLTGRLLLVLLLALTGWAAYAQFHSVIALTLAQRQDKTVYIAVLTQPAMTFSYNPATHKSVLTTVKRRKTPKDLADNAADLFASAAIEPAQLRYYAPRTLKRDEYWDLFKQTLESWRYNPLLAVRAAWEYVAALHDKRTNLNPAEFLLLAMEISRMEISDFTVRTAGEKPRAKKPASSAAPKDHIPDPVEDRAPLAVEDRPLIVEILNGAGKKGAALELTQYLRDQSQKGLLRVDVLQYDNYPGPHQKKTRIVDYTGRLAQIKQLTRAIGVNNEIESEKQGTAICDVRIIIGDDFKQPL